MEVPIKVLASAPRLGRGFCCAGYSHEHLQADLFTVPPLFRTPHTGTPNLVAIQPFYSYRS